MTTRTRKLVGSILLMAFIAGYALLLVPMAAFLQLRDSKVLELAFYVLGGLAWVLPAGLLIRWMHRPYGRPEE